MRMTLEALLERYISGKMKRDRLIANLRQSEVSLENLQAIKARIENLSTEQAPLARDFLCLARLKMSMDMTDNTQPSV